MAISAAPPGTSPASDAVGSAKRGDCFVDHIVDDHSHLTPVVCGPGTYQVIQRLDGTTDTSGCDDLVGYDFSVWRADPQMVLCLSYQYAYPEVAHAPVGSCIGQLDSSEEWRPYACGPGTFKVLARHYGRTDDTECREWPQHDRSLSYETNLVQHRVSSSVVMSS